MIPLDAPDEWPKIGRGGWWRNEHGQALVKHPVTLNSNLRYRGGSDILGFGEPYTGDPAHGERGTLTHNLSDLADRGLPLTEELYLEGERLEVSRELLDHMYARRQVFRQQWGLTAIHIELMVVHDDWKVATNIDRVDQTADGDWVVSDIKTASDWVKLNYLAQLAACVHSLPYDIETGRRLAWERELVTDVAYIEHFPINAARQDDDPTAYDWQRVEVKTAPGVALVEAFLAVENDTTHKDAFRQIAAPLPPDVERSGGGDATHGSETPPPPTLDDWRQHALTWDARRTEAFKLYRQAHGLTGDASEAQKLHAYNKFDQEYHFRDVETTPAVRPATTPAATVVQLPTNPDEGPDVDDQGTYKALEQRYMALDVARRQWITDITKQAAAAGTPISMGAETGRRTVRRWEILRGLVALADGFDNDDALRGCIGAAIGYELADSLAFNHGQLVGCMNHDEAAGFAKYATRLVEGLASMSFDDNGRCRVAA